MMILYEIQYNLQQHFVCIRYHASIQTHIQCLNVKIFYLLTLLSSDWSIFHAYHRSASTKEKLTQNKI